MHNKNNNVINNNSCWEFSDHINPVRNLNFHPNLSLQLRQEVNMSAESSYHRHLEELITSRCCCWKLLRHFLLRKKQKRKLSFHRCKTLNHQMVPQTPELVLCVHGGQTWNCTSTWSLNDAFNDSSLWSCTNIFFFQVVIIKSKPSHISVVID